MSVDVTDEHNVALYCNTSDYAFGPIFTSDDHAWDFIDWLRTVELAPIIAQFGFERCEGDPTDPRSWDENGLEMLHAVWRDRRCDEDGNLKEESIV